MSTRAALVLAAALAAPPVWAGSPGGVIAVSLRVLPRVQSGLPGGARAALVGSSGSRAALPCGVEDSAACAEAVAAAARASRGTGPVVVTLLPDGSPTAIVER